MTALKVVPPSLVSMASPGNAGLAGPSAFGPTATHVEVDGQVIEKSCPEPPADWLLYPGPTGVVALKHRGADSNAASLRGTCHCHETRHPLRHRSLVPG